MTNLESLVVTLSLRAEQLVNGLHVVESRLHEMGEQAEKAQEKIKEMAEKSEAFVDVLKEHVTGLLGALASVGAFMMFTEHTVKAQVATGRLAAEAKMSVVELGALQIAADKMGGSAEGVNRSITMMGEKLSVLGTKMRGAKMAGMALGMVLGKQGKEAEAAGVAMFKGKKPMEALMLLNEHMQGMDFFKAKKLGAMSGITDEGMIRNLIKSKEAFAEFVEEQKKYAATEEDIEHSLKFEEAQKDVKFAVEKVAMMIMQDVIPALKWFADKLMVVADWFRERPALIKAAITGITVAVSLLGIHAAIMGKQMVVAWMASGYAALKAGVMFVATGVRAHVAWLMALGPIGLVIAAIELIIAGLTYLYFKFEGVRTVVNKVFNEIVGTVKVKLESMLYIFSEMWEAIKSELTLLIGIFTLNFDKIKEGWSGLIGHIKNAFKEFGYSVRDDILEVVFAIIDAFDKIWDGVKNSKLFKWLEKNNEVTVHAEGDFIDNGEGGVYAVAPSAGASAADAQRPSVVNDSRSSNKSAASVTHIDELNIVAPAAADADAVAGEIHGALQSRQNMVNLAEAY